MTRSTFWTDSKGGPESPQNWWEEPCKCDHEKLWHDIQFNGKYKKCLAPECKCKEFKNRGTAW